MAKAKHASWLKDKTTQAAGNKGRGRSASRGEGGKTSDAGDDEEGGAESAARSMLPRMDFAMGMTGRTPVAGPVRPVSTSTTSVVQRFLFCRFSVAPPCCIALLMLFFSCSLPPAPLSDEGKAEAVRALVAPPRTTRLKVLPSGQL